MGSRELLVMLAAAAAVAAGLAGCAVDQGVRAELVRRLPDGSVVEAKFEREWAAGPVEATAEYDPETGKLVIRWSSDVDLEPAERASIAQAEAQTRFLTELAGLLQFARNAAAGIPLPSPPASTPSRAELGGMGPPADQETENVATERRNP